ncbi:MAG: hypothetical protein BACD_00786 [Bacteroides rodentium]|jgi:hypothetical protein
MLKHSVQTELLLILWVTKLIYKENPMYAVLAKDTILIDVINAIIKVDGLFLNADAGFDCDTLRSTLQRKGIIANICINRRREETDSK